MDLAFDAYLRGDDVGGRNTLADAIQQNENLRNPHLLMRKARMFAHELIRNPLSEAKPSIKFMRAFLGNIPDEASALKPFSAGELSDWLLTSAYHEYQRGELKLTRSYVLQAVRISPWLITERSNLSLLLQSIFGTNRLKTYRNVVPEGTEKQITISQRSRLIADYLRAHDVVKINIGCGDNLLDGWLNTDLSVMNRGGVVYLDATERMPFENATVDFIFSEHMIEHISYIEGYRFLEECLRVLKPGGFIRITTPSYEFLNELYNDQTGKFQKYMQWSVEQWVGGEITTPAVVVNNFVRNWGHQFIYDAVTLMRVLDKIGYVEMEQCEVGKSRQPTLQDLEGHSEQMPFEFNLTETMVIEARKAPENLGFNE